MSKALWIVAWASASSFKAELAAEFPDDGVAPDFCEGALFDVLDRLVAEPTLGDPSGVEDVGDFGVSSDWGIAHEVMGVVQ
jgi:hypothetical protein